MEQSSPDRRPHGRLQAGLLVLIAAAGCSRPGAAPEPEADAGSGPDAAGVADAAVDPHPVIGGTYRDGELIARYDRSLWAQRPADEIVFAFFDPAHFAAYPDDHSVVFRTDADLPFAPSAPAASSYRDFLRQAGITIDRVPLDHRAYVITAGERYHLTENGYGDFAWDLVETDDLGVRFKGAGAVNEDYLIFDQPVYVPNGGYVVEVVRDSPDNVPGSAPPDPVENLVGLHLGGSFYLYLLHFRQGTIPAEVEVGATLLPGAYVGRAGSSGLSLEPHLHMAVLWYDGTRSWSVPAELAGIRTATSATATGTLHAFLSPPSGVWIE